MLDRIRNEKRRCFRSTAGLSAIRTKVWAAAGSRDSLRVARDPSGAVRPDAPINKMPINRYGGWHSEERLYRTMVQVTINDGRGRVGVPIFGHPAPEMRTDSPPVLNRIKR